MLNFPRKVVTISTKLKHIPIDKLILFINYQNIHNHNDETCLSTENRN